ncbi:MAG TPA: hypothetical protein VM055_04915 [Novosphingobium sp.]|nr:hypothetical protein [Novosphingobium sp.]
MSIFTTYRRAGPFAWVLGALAMAFAANVFVAIGRHSHSVSDTLYALYPFWGVTFLGWDWLVRRIAEVKT